MNPQREQHMPRASVVVLTCGAAETTLDCLESIVAGAYGNLQIVVVCNGVDADMVRAVQLFVGRVREYNIDVRVLLNQTNLGACRGRNQALAEVDGQYVAFVDNDILCRDRLWLNRAVKLFASNPRIGMVGPRLVRMTLPTCLECAGYAIDSQCRFTALGANCPLEDPRFRQVREVQAVGNFVTRTEIIRAVGGFDTAFDPFGFENIDCCYRIKAAGWSVVCDGESDLYHSGHVTTGSFDAGGQRVLFAKSLLLRKRWRDVIERERPLYEALMSIDAADVRGGIRA